MTLGEDLGIERDQKEVPIAIVILNWNGARLLEKYLPILIEHTDSSLAEIIVADNGSQDDSVHLVNAKGVQLIKLEQNYGFATGYNRAIQMLPHQYILLLNSDVRVEAGWLEPLYHFICSHQTSWLSSPP